MIKTVDSDMVILFWESHKAPRKDVRAAFEAEGMEGLLPLVDYFAAIKATTKHIADSYGVGAGGRVEYRGLSHDRDAVGAEARRLIKGAKKNDLPFLFSLGAVRDPLNDTRVEIRVLECDPALCPEVAKQRLKVEKAATDYWKQQCDFITANDLTNAIAAVVKKCRGFLLRNSGVVWFMPEDMVGPYQRIGAALQPHGVSMQAVYWNPVVNDTLLSHVTGELERRCMAVFQGQIEEAQEMRQRGAKARSNGKQSRLEEWIDAEATLQHNKGLLGKAFVKVCKAAQAAREAIGAEAVKMFQ